MFYYHIYGKKVCVSRHVDMVTGKFLLYPSVLLIIKQTLK